MTCPKCLGDLDIRKKELWCKRHQEDFENSEQPLSNDMVTPEVVLITNGFSREERRRWYKKYRKTVPEKISATDKEMIDIICRQASLKVYRPK